MNRTHWRIRSLGLAAWVGLAGLVSCVSSDDAPAGGRVEHPDLGAKEPPLPTSLAPPPAPAPVPSEPSEHPLSLSEVEEPCSGLTRPPLDKAIAEDDPARPWSKNVPKRHCTNDGECGDGFCDRGRCAAIWTSTLQYGQRCERDCRQYGDLPCIDGRYRSCVSDAECAWARHIQDPKCAPDPFVPGARECHGVIGGGGGGIVVPGPPPQRPRP